MGVPAAERAERVRWLLAPVVGLLGAALGMCCLVTVPDLIANWPVLRSLTTATAAWAGLAGGVAVAAATVVLLGCNRTGSAPALALGAVAAGSGLLLARDVDAAAQLVLTLVTLAVGVGALLPAGLCMVEELPRRWVRPTYAAWLTPLAAGWGLLGWAALRDQGGGATLAVRPPIWVLGAVVGLVLSWAGLTLLREPARRPPPSATGWENAWAAITGLVATIVCIVMLVGFQPQLAASWARPVVLLTVGVAVAGLVGCARLIPLPELRPAFFAVVVSLLCGPTCLHLLTQASWDSSGGLDAWVAIALTAAGLFGCLAGWRWPGAALSAGPALLALASAGGWLLPSDEALMVLAATPFSAGLAASVTSGLRVAATSRMGVRYLTGSGLAALVTGLVSAFPLTWAVGAELTGRQPADRAGARVLLGLAFALFVMTSAAVSVLHRRAGGAGVPDARPVTHRRAGAAGRHP